MNWIKNFPSMLLIWLLGRIASLSWPSIYRLSNFFSNVFFNIVKYRKDVVLGNLHNSFPDKTEEDINRIASQYYQNVTDIIFETIKLQKASREEILERFHSKSNLFEDYYRQNKSLVVVLGHLGNWELANLFGSLDLSHQIVVVYHKLANDTFEEWFYQMRTRFGSQLVPMKEAYAWSTENATRPFLFLLVNDQSPRPEKAYWTTFLNQSTGVFRGAETISRRLNVPVIYAGIMRDEGKRGYYNFHLELITDDPKSEPNNAILEKQIGFLEKDILKDPANWLWSHKRWKHKKPAHLQPEQLLESNI
jgi:KDO2-lipid IV(A) lauroyltransferase